jgi:polyhydroxyalkanoate synthesis regulator phasin
VALGSNALLAATGSGNIGVGAGAGSDVGAGNANIEIGNFGLSTDGTGSGSNGAAIRIGTGGDQTQTFIAGISGVTVAGGAEVFVDSSGQLGTVTSSQRFKTDIRDMGSDSDALLALRPVTFRYKPELDPKGIPQYGLVAEEVEKVSPDLVVRDKNNKAYSVRYNAVNAMLLNEFRKQHEKVEIQEKTIEDLQGQVATLTAAQKEVAAQQAEITALKAQFEALAKTVASK